MLTGLKCHFWHVNVYFTDQRNENELKILIAYFQGLAFCLWQLNSQ